MYQLKRALPFLLAIAVLFVCLVVQATAVSQTPADGLTMLEDYESAGKVGTDLMGSKVSVWGSDGVGKSAVIDDTVRGDGNQVAKISRSELVEGYSNEVYFHFVRGKLAGQEGVILYVKMPVKPNAPAENNGIDILLRSDAEGHTGNFKYADKSEAAILPIGDADWQTITASDGWLSLPSGFEGYIRLNLSRFTSNWDGGLGKNINEALPYIDAVQIYLSYIGGTAENGGDTALYVDDLMGCDSAYTGGALFPSESSSSESPGTQSTTSSTPDKPVVPDPVKISEGLYLAAGYENFEQGQDLVENGSVFVPDGAKAAADGRVHGNGEQAAMVTAELAAVGGGELDFFFKEGAATGKTGLIFYIKMPLHAYDPTWENGLLILLRSHSEGHVGNFKTGGNARVGILSRGETVWKERQTDAGGWLALPAGFEGYISVDFSSLVLNWNDGLGTDLEQAKMYFDTLQMYLSSYGGENNPLYVDDVMLFDSNYHDSVDFLPEDWTGRPEPSTEATTTTTMNESDFVIPGLNDSTSAATAPTENGGSVNTGVTHTFAPWLLTGIALLTIAALIVLYRKKPAEKV